MNSRIRTLLAIGLIGAVAAIAPSAAQAKSANVVTVVKQQLARLDSSADAKFFKNLNIKSDAGARTAIPKIRAYQKLIENATLKIAAASATNAVQKQGQKDLVKGFRGVAAAVGSTAKGLQDKLDGHQTEATGDIQLAFKQLEAASKIADKGAKLLGVSGV